MAPSRALPVSCPVEDVLLSTLLRELTKAIQKVRPQDGEAPWSLLVEEVGFDPPLGPLGTTVSTALAPRGGRPLLAPGLQWEHTRPEGAWVFEEVSKDRVFFALD